MHAYNHELRHTARCIFLITCHTVRMVERILFWPDTHIGLENSHDERAFNLTLGIAKELKIDMLYIIGDFEDFYCLSNYLRDPSIKSILKDELFLIHEKIKVIDSSLKNCEKHYLGGNHTNRLDTFIARNCKEIFETLSIESVLKLKENNFIYHKFTPLQLIKVRDLNLYCRHEPFGVSSDSSSRKSMCNIISGHNHQISNSSVTSANGESFTSYSIGCLVNLKHKVFEYVKSMPNWKLGFGLVTSYDGQWFFEQIEIKNYTCKVEGKIYVG